MSGGLRQAIVHGERTIVRQTPAGTNHTSTNDFLAELTSVWGKGQAAAVSPFSGTSCHVE